MLRDRLLAAVANQLSRPSGPFGRLVGRGLNRGNRTVVTAAVDAVNAGSCTAVADVGFGGGVGLTLLLDRVPSNGVVHGIEVSGTMLDVARRRFRTAVGGGRLVLHEASMERLPLGDGSLDAAISTNTLYFVADVDAAFAALARVLRSGGTLALGVGDPAAMAKMPFTGHGFTLRPVEEIRAGLLRAGFADVDDRRVGSDEHAFHIVVARRS